MKYIFDAAMVDWNIYVAFLGDLDFGSSMLRF